MSEVGMDNLSRSVPCQVRLPKIPYIITFSFLWLALFSNCTKLVAGFGYILIFSPKFNFPIPVSVPVMFQYNATPMFYLEAGPELSFLVSAKGKYEGTTQDVKEVFETFDIGLGLGAGYYFTPNIGLTARYVAGLTDVAKNRAANDSSTAKNNVFQIGLAYKFSK